MRRISLTISARNVPRVDRQEPAHPGALVFEISRRAVHRAVMNHVLLQLAEDEAEYVEKVDADVRSDAAGLALVTLPRRVVPQAAGGNVSEVDVVDLAVGLGSNALAKLEDGRVQAQLQDCEHAVPAVALDFGKTVDVPRIEHQRLLADGVGMAAQSETHMGVMKIVRRPVVSLIPRRCRGAMYPAAPIRANVRELVMSGLIRSRLTSLRRAQASTTCDAHPA